MEKKEKEKRKKKKKKKKNYKKKKKKKGYCSLYIEPVTSLDKCRVALTKSLF